ncbi:hypothetical protein ACJX0J_036105, partial [Zea mays]
MRINCEVRAERILLLKRFTLLAGIVNNSVTPKTAQVAKSPEYLLGPVKGAVIYGIVSVRKSTMEFL